MKKNNFSNETEFIWDETEHELPYTTVTNDIINNDKIEFNSQGIYLQIFKFKNSPKHKVYMSALENTGKGSRRDIQRGILNLRLEGFLLRTIMRDNGKFKGYQYKIRRTPLALSLTEKALIYSETKVNQEYTLKIYGQNFVNEIESELNNINGSVGLDDETKKEENTDCTNWVIPNCVIPKRVTKKENGFKKEKSLKKVLKDDDTENQKPKDQKLKDKKPKDKKPKDKKADTKVSNHHHQNFIDNFVLEWNKIANKQVMNMTTNRLDKMTTIIETLGEEKTMCMIQVINYSEWAKSNLDFSHMIKDVDTFTEILEGRYNKRQKEEKQKNFTKIYRHNWDLEKLEIAADERLYNSTAPTPAAPHAKQDHIPGIKKKISDERLCNSTAPPAKQDHIPGIGKKVADEQLGKYDSTQLHKLIREIDEMCL